MSSADDSIFDENDIPDPTLEDAFLVLWPIPDKGLRKRLPRIKAETLVVVGDNDRIVPPIYGNEISALIPNARVETIKDGGHMFVVEQADTFANLVTDFLSA